MSLAKSPKKSYSLVDFIKTYEIFSMLNHIDSCDVQNRPDNRNLPINWVGIKSLRHPIIIEDVDLFGNTFHQSSVGTFYLAVDLPKELKGTHMSRFVALLNENPVTLSVANQKAFLDNLITHLNATNGKIEVQFPFFIQKTAPVSKVMSLMDYEVTLKATLHQGEITTSLHVVIPVTSLCPCSKHIADYGAHNQRSHVTISAFSNGQTKITNLIRLVENEASSELYGLLKRSDEKLVTEKAFNNPKFVEDMVRDVAQKLQDDPTLMGFTVTSENFESIHNHSAFAEITIP